MLSCQLIPLLVATWLVTSGHGRIVNSASSSTHFKPSAKEYQIPSNLNNVGSNNITSAGVRFFQQQPNFHNFYNPGTASYPNPGVGIYSNPGVASYPNPGTASYPNPGAASYPNPGAASYPKFNSLYYPTPGLQQQPSHSFLHGVNNHHRQIRVPGNIFITLNGRDAEITCQFERYMILVQGIYWHHNVEPYGSYFDIRNGFGPHVTVSNINPWKSILTIKDFTEDDYGPYRCISTAVLPADSGFYNNNNNYPEVRTNELEDSKRKVRFTREIKDTPGFNSPHHPVYDPFFSNYLNGFNFNSDFRPHHHNIPTQQTFLSNLNNNHNNNNNFYTSPPTNFNSHRFPSPFNLLHLPGLSNLWSVHAPYYRPSYSLSTVYQEVNFAPISQTTLSPGK